MLILLTFVFVSFFLMFVALFFSKKIQFISYLVFMLTSISYVYFTFGYEKALPFCIALTAGAFAIKAINKKQSKK